MSTMEPTSRRPRDGADSPLSPPQAPISVLGRLALERRSLELTMRLVAAGRGHAMSHPDLQRARDRALA